jgi:hypothetical protein
LAQNALRNSGDSFLRKNIAFKCNQCFPKISFHPICRDADLTATFKFQKCRQFFVGTHNKAVSVAVMRVNNPERSPLRVKA